MIYREETLLLDKGQQEPTVEVLLTVTNVELQDGYVLDIYSDYVEILVGRNLPMLSLRCSKQELFNRPSF